MKKMAENSRYFNNLNLDSCSRLGFHRLSLFIGNSQNMVHRDYAGVFLNCIFNFKEHFWMYNTLYLIDIVLIIRLF